VLDRLTRHIYVSSDPDDITGRLEVAFKKAIEVEEMQKKLDTAIRADKIKRVYGVDWVDEAVRLNVLNEHEASQVRELEALAERAVAVDHFDPKEIPTG
jgi:acyl-CoA dehydrogenase